MISIGERPAVRQAAIRLVRVLMQEAGLTLADLVQRQRTDAKRRRQRTRREAPAQPCSQPAVSAACDQLVSPANAPLSAAQKRAGIVKAPPGVPGVVARVAPMVGDAVTPAGVKVTQCPSGRDTRFTADGPVVGEFTRDWQAKRGAGR